MPGAPLPIGSFTSPRVKRVHYGEGCLSGLPAAVDELGGTRVFIITGNSLMQQGTILARIQELLGDRCAGVFGETRQHVPRDTVLAATRAAQSADADLLISFGGGTPNDTAKLVALCLAENVTDERQLDRYRVRFQYPDKVEIPAVHNPCLPHISISTTLSAGEFTNFAGATDEERKVKDLYTGDGLWVSTAFLDPVVTTATPGWLWASTGIRSVDHAIETVCSKISFPFSGWTGLGVPAALASTPSPVHQRPRRPRVGRLLPSSRLDVHLRVDQRPDGPEPRLGPSAWRQERCSPRRDILHHPAPGDGFQPPRLLLSNNGGLLRPWVSTPGTATTTRLRLRRSLP